MTDKQLTTPVLLVIFNRPETSDLCFEAIRKVKPKKLYIAADGPRENRPDDTERCKKAREIAKRVDWPCELKTLFREKNLGCRLGTTGGINWMLQNEEYGIIFDDDCIADPTFFYFCEELLEKYKNDERVMHICGTNFQQKNQKFNIKESYYFSKISQNWGWATWKRAWIKYYEPQMESWPQTKNNEKFNQWLGNGMFKDYWFHVFDRRFRGEITDWDIPWTFSCMKHRGLCIVPKHNLVTNIGSGQRGTHGVKSDRLANTPSIKIPLPLIHPQIFMPNLEADSYIQTHMYDINTNMKRKILFFLKSRLPYIFYKIKLLTK
jgi:hypothetical protein